jgi:Fic family protein
LDALGYEQLVHNLALEPRTCDVTLAYSNKRALYWILGHDDASLMDRRQLAPAVRDRLKRYPPPHDAHYGVVPLPPTEEPIIIGAAGPEHRAAMEALGRADALAAQQPSHFLLSRVLVRQEAVASSDIEGTHSKLDALLEVEETDDADASDADKQVRDYAIALEAALRDVVANGYDAFTIHTIEQLHRSLMRGDSNFVSRHGQPGRFRRKQVRIGGRDFGSSTFNPPPYADVLQCMTDHIAYLRSEGMQQMNQSIIAQIAIAHSHFEAVHPFPDGNGRVGRLLLPLMLRAAGHTPLYLAPYIAAFKTDYYEALRASQQRLDHQPLIAHLSRAIVSTVEDAETAVRRLEKLRVTWLQRRKFRQKSAAQRMIELLSWHPVVTTRTVERLLDASPAAARTAINQLAEAGILTERTGKMRYRVFQAREVLEIYKNPSQLPENGG